MQNDKRIDKLRTCAVELLGTIERFGLTDAKHISRGSDAARQIWFLLQGPLLNLRMELDGLPRKSAAVDGPALLPALPVLSGDRVRDAELQTAVSLLDMFEESGIGWRSHEDKEHFGIWAIPGAAVEQLRQAVRLLGEHKAAAGVEGGKAEQPAAGSKLGVNAKVLNLYQKKPESVGWSLRRLEEATGCSKSAISECSAYRSAKLLNEQAKLERLDKQSKVRDKSGKRRNVRPDE